MKKSLATFLPVFLAVLISGLVFSYLYFRKTVTSSNANITKTTIIEIHNDEKTAQIASDLAGLNLIKNTDFFMAAVLLSRKNIKPGFYEITPNMSTMAILDLILNGKTKVIKVTIPEGYRTEQIGQKLAALNIVSLSEFLSVAKQNEGKLFPDTYFMNPRMSPSEIIEMMTADYANRTSGLSVSGQDLVIASIVEKEAANDADRALIAGIYLNRLRLGMKLESDPTVAYARDTINFNKVSALDQQSYTFWRPAKTVEFTSVISPFNTYLAAGAPPTPICNPGLKSIQAVKTPQASNYLYFLYGADGIIHPNANGADHQVMINKYL